MNDPIYYASLILLILLSVYLLIVIFSRLKSSQLDDRRVISEQKILKNELLNKEKKQPLSELDGWKGWRRFVVKKKKPEAIDITSFYLEPYDKQSLPTFYPGQFLTFNLPIKDKRGKLPISRCYSLSDSPKRCRKMYRISIKRVGSPPKQPELPAGASSTYFHDSLVEGNVIEVGTPNGMFYLDTSKETPVVLIAGGVGITPMLSMLNHIIDIGSQRETWFFYGLRNSSEHVMKKYLERVAKKHTNINLVVCYSATFPADVRGSDYQYKGRVSVELFKRLLPSNNYDFYLCASIPMMNAIENDLAKWGVPKKHVYSERFGPDPKTIINADNKPVEINFSKSDKTLSWDKGCASLLEFAEENEIPIASTCRMGSCGSCETAIRSGEIKYISEPSFAVQENHCLTCISVPKSSFLKLDV